MLRELVREFKLAPAVLNECQIHVALGLGSLADGALSKEKGLLVLPLPLIPQPQILIGPGSGYLLADSFRGRRPLPVLQRTNHLVHVVVRVLGFGQLLPELLGARPRFR